MNYRIVIAMLLLTFMSYRAIRMASMFEAYCYVCWNKNKMDKDYSVAKAKFESFLMMMLALSALFMSYMLLYVVMDFCATLTYQSLDIQKEDMRTGMLIPMTTIGVLSCYMPVRRFTMRAFARGKIRVSRKKAKMKQTK